MAFVTTSLPAPANAAPATATPPEPQVQASGEEEHPEPVLTPTKVTVNRSVPKVSKPSLQPTFSEKPETEEIRKARVFAEPLVPLGDPTANENADLASVLRPGRGDDVAVIEGHLARHPDSAWAPSLRLNLGLVHRRKGALTKALDSYRLAWEAAKDRDDDEGRAVADRAIAERADLLTRVGRQQNLEALLDDIEGRDIRGSASQWVLRAQQAVWFLQNMHEKAVPSGPVAVQRVLAFLHGEDAPAGPIWEVHATPEGATLLEMRDLAGRVGLDMQMAFRAEGEFPLPAVAHLRLGHFAAVIRREGSDYLLDDPILGGHQWISADILAAESSGYFLIPGGQLPRGWRAVADEEGRLPRGKCAGTLPNPRSGPPPDFCCEGGSCPMTPPMATYAFQRLVAGLYVTDTPVRYTPPRGPAIQFTVGYSQREAFQPALFSYSNLGRLWTHNWFGWVEDDPGNPNATVKLYKRGGGVDLHQWNSATSSYVRDLEAEADLFQGGGACTALGASVCYEQRFPDGSINVFSQPDGAATYPRKVFLTQVIDPQGNKVTLTIDASFRLVAIQDAIGQVTTLSYEHPTDPLKITKVTDPFGRYATFEYNSQGQLQKITDVIGIASEFAYGQNDFMTLMTTPYGTTTFATQGGVTSDRKIEAVDPLGGREALRYVAGSSGIASSESTNLVPAGFQSRNSQLDMYNTFYWDKRAMALYPWDVTKAQVTHWIGDGTCNGDVLEIKTSEKKPLENRVWYLYPGFNPGIVGYPGYSSDPKTIARVFDDGSTQAYHYEYNPLGKVTRETDPLGRTKTYVYDPTGMDLLEVRRVNGQNSELLQSFTYNSQHQPLTVADAAGQVMTYTYNAQGKVATVVTPPRDGLTQAQRTTTYSYDTNGLLQGVTGPVAGASTTYTYDGYGRERTVTDVDSYTLTYDYDALDRTTKVTFPDGTYEQTVYNRLDAEQQRDRLGRWSRTFYDALRRPTAARDAAGRTITQEWCNCGSLDKLIDPNGNATTWERDVQSRVTKETRANGSFKEYTYETTTSRLKKLKDAKNQEINYSYLLDNRLQQTSYTNAQIATPTVSFTYDPVEGRLATMTDGTGTTTYGYAPVGSLGADRLASVDGPLANDAVGYTYDELGRVTSRTLNGVTTTWQYDALGRLTTLGDPIGNFVYGYVGSTGRVSSVTYPNGQTSTYAYLPVNQDLRLQEIHHKKPGGVTLNKFNYTYDVVGNIQTWAQQTDTSPAQTYTFEYDRADQLTAATLAAATPKRYRYAYDASGNRIVEQIDDAATLSTHDNMNRLLTHVPGGGLTFRGTVSEPATVTVGGQPATVSGTNQFSGTAQVPSGTSQVTVQATDPSGNVRTNIYELTQTGATKAFLYDANGNLCAENGASCTDTNATKRYEWDAENRLTAVKQGENTLASFTYDGGGRRASKTASGGATSYVYSGPQFLEERPSVGAVRYVYGPGIDLPLAQVVGGATTYNIANHLGSVVRTTDAAANPTLTREYDPWGNLLQGSTTSGYAFTGREWDLETGLYYYRARYYDPRVGRFLSEDSLGFTAGVNRYQYTNGAPVRWRDPSGQIIDCSGPTYIGPPNMVGPTPNGQGGWTTVRYRCRVYPCKPRSNSTWGFDVVCSGVIEQIFQEDPASPSSNSPGLTLGQHEDLHVQDYQNWYKCRNVNQHIRTEGFRTPCECQKAYENFEKNLEQFKREGDKATGRRD